MVQKRPPGFLHNEENDRAKKWDYNEVVTSMLKQSCRWGQFHPSLKLDMAPGIL